MPCALSSGEDVAWVPPGDLDDIARRCLATHPKGAWGFLSKVELFAVRQDRLRQALFLLCSCVKILSKIGAGIVHPLYSVRP